MSTHYLDGGIPAEFAENYKNYVPDHEDLTYEEFLLQQGSVYFSFQERGNLGQSLVWQEVESPRGESSDSQEALDEALARSLEELGEDFNDFEVTERSSTTTVTRESSIEAPSRTTSQSARQDDDVDPDNMTYDELIELGENIGAEKKGVSEDFIAMLPTFKYKRGFFSKKKENADCVICLMEYKNGDQLTTLPCLHQYHRECITEWLSCSKACPVCNHDVQFLFFVASDLFDWNGACPVCKQDVQETEA